MSTKLVSHVSDTARWVAMYRALESERPDAIFHDRYARRLAGPEGQAILDGLPKARQWAWPMVVRTAVMDEIILAALAQGADLVVNLAAGLDARPYRLALPPSLPWYEVDLPDLLAYKRERLEGEHPACPLERVSLDLRDEAGRRALFARLGSQARAALVITEGLLVYLDPAEVAGLARDLHTGGGFRWWLTDLAGPRLLKMLNRAWGPVVRAGNAPFRFAPAESTRFFAPHGWREVAFRSIFEESLRLRRAMRFARLWALASRLFPRRMREDFHRMSGIALLERTD